MIKMLKVKDLKCRRRPNRDWYYNDLKKSIKELGLMMPLVVNQNNYVIDGLLRFATLKELGVEDVACHIVNMTPAQAIEHHLISSVKRIETTPLDFARIIQRLLKHHTIEVISDRIRRPVYWIRNQLLLLNLTEQQQKDLLAKKITLEEAYKLGRKNDGSILVYNNCIPHRDAPVLDDSICQLV